MTVDVIEPTLASEWHAATRHAITDDLLDWPPRVRHVAVPPLSILVATILSALALWELRSAAPAEAWARASA